MKSRQKTMLMTAMAASIAITAPGPAHADAFAQSILVIDNFRLLHANGTPFTASDFPLLTAVNGAYARGALGDAFTGSMQSQHGNPDVQHQSLGSGALPRGENDFMPFSGPRSGRGDFAYADQNMRGSLVTNNLNPAGALMQTRADASLTMNGSASGGSSLSSSTTFSFALGVGEHMTISFSATPFSQAYVSQGSASASAAMSWRVSIVDLSTGLTVFAYQPDALNALGQVGRSDGVEGASTYDPGALFFNATTDLLGAGDSYEVVIEQSTMAGTLQSQAVPEPGTLAVCGLGLLAIALVERRRRPKKRAAADAPRQF